MDFDPKTEISTTQWTFSFTYTYEKITYTQACKQGTLSNFCQECTAGGKNRKIKNFVPYWSVCCLLCMINCFLLLYPNAIKDQLKFEAALRVILLSLMNHFPGGTSEWGQLFYGVEFEFFNYCLGFHENLLESK